MKKILLISLLLLNTLIFAQKENIIWLFNGKTKTAISYSVNNYDGVIDYVNTKGRNKTVDIEDVFKILKKNGESEYFYSQEMDEEDEIPIKDMEDFIEGEQFARKNKHGVGAFIEGALVGGAFGFLSTTLGMPIGALPIFAPFVNSPLIGAFGVSTDAIRNKIPEKIDNEFFVEGYKKATKKKRFNNSLVSGTLGFVITLATFIIIGS